MENRKRNTAIFLIGAGLFFLVGKLIGFFTVAAVFLIWFGIHKIHTTREKSGYVLTAIGVVILLGSHLGVVISILLISLGYFYIQSRRTHRDGVYVQKQNILQSIKWDKEPWVLRNTSIWFLVGEIRLDLSLALPEQQETTWVLQGIIGDVDIIVPDDWGVSVSGTVLFGQIDLDRQKESGILNKIVWQSPNFETSERKVTFLLTSLIGDVEIKML